MNVNGLELSVLLLFLDCGEVAAEAAESNTDANSFAAGNNVDGSQINNFRFICINKNNNTVTEAEEEPIPPSQGTILYVTNKGDNTVEIYDNSDPTAPVRVGQFNAGNLFIPFGIALQGTTLYVV